MLSSRRGMVADKNVAAGEYVGYVGVEEVRGRRREAAGWRPGARRADPG